MLEASKLLHKPVPHDTRPVRLPRWPYEFHVLGLPAPQGSKRFWGFDENGHSIIADSCLRTKPWQETVKWAAIDARTIHRWETLRGAVAIETTFTMYKPKNAPKRKITYPIAAPDLDKLERAAWDALGLKHGVGLIEDDSCVVENRSRKVFPNEHPQALSVPGAVIRIWPMAAWNGFTHYDNVQQQEFLIG